MTFTNLFPFEESGAHSVKKKKNVSYIQTK